MYNNRTTNLIDNIKIYFYNFQQIFVNGILEISKIILIIHLKVNLPS